MKKTSTLLISLAATVTLACSSPDNMPNTSVFGDIGLNNADISGFSWDPEAFWFEWATCGGPNCPIPPIRVPTVPVFEKSLINGATVNLFDPILAGMGANPPWMLSSMPTNTEGLWFIENAPIRQTAPFFAFTFPPAPGGMPLQTMGPPFLLDVPPGDYVPTLTLQPIFTGASSVCLGEPGDLLSTTGILQAIAKYETLIGNPTTVADLVDQMGTKYGGVVVFWMYLPASALARVPAFGTHMEGVDDDNKMVPLTPLYVEWAPPKTQGLEMLQSDRGFFVNPMPKPDDQGNIGITAFLFPPTHMPGHTASFTAVDPVTDMSQGRPWNFPSLPPIPVAPGYVAFGELPGLLAQGTLPPYFICLGNQ